MELHRITAQLRLSGEQITKAQLIDKTLSPFPPTTAILAHQYKNMKFTKHNRLMSHLLLAEKHQHILFKNAEVRLAREIHTMLFARPSPKPTTGSLAVHLSEAPRRSPRGFKCRPLPKQFKFRPKGQKPRYYRKIINPQSNLLPHAISVAAWVTILGTAVLQHTLWKCIRNYKNS